MILNAKTVLRNEKGRAVPQKAVVLGKQKSKKNTKPNWEYSSSYEFLVKLFFKQKQYEKAKKWAEEGGRLYLNHFPLKKLNNRLRAK